MWLDGGQGYAGNPLTPFLDSLKQKLLLEMLGMIILK